MKKSKKYLFIVSMTIREHLLECIYSCMARRNLSRWMFGKLAVGDTKFVSNLEAGMDCRTQKADAVFKFAGASFSVNSNHNSDPKATDGGGELEKGT